MLSQNARKDKEISFLDIPGLNRQHTYKSLEFEQSYLEYDSADSRSQKGDTHSSFHKISAKSYKEMSPRPGSACSRASASGRVTLGYGQWNKMQSAAQLMTVKYLDKIAHHDIHPEVTCFKRNDL